MVTLPEADIAPQVAKIAELQGRIDELRETAEGGTVDIDAEVGRLLELSPPCGNVRRIRLGLKSWLSRGAARASARRSCAF